MNHNNVITSLTYSNFGFFIGIIFSTLIFYMHIHRQILNILGLLLNSERVFIRSIDITT
jgi:hypothetical protein